MDRFEYLIGLVSLIVGLGLADLATSLHRLIKQRARTKWDALTLATAALAAFTLIWIWYNVWDLRSFPGVGGFWFYLSLLLEMTLLYLAAAASLPDEAELAEGEGRDLTAYLARHRRYIWILFGLFFTSYSLRSVYFVSRDGVFAPQELLWIAMTCIPIVLSVASAFARRRSAQWILLLALSGWAVFSAIGLSI
ncbi:hypothetical protein [Brevundimonas sp.]|jgi:hypothetical protein|uniref:hypothetical protein n=1 Tax=Brevundimonas sp. TaxID=1871086 RepID=UPI0037BE4887